MAWHRIAWIGLEEKFITAAFTRYSVPCVLYIVRCIFYIAHRGRESIDMTHVHYTSYIGRQIWDKTLSVCVETYMYYMYKYGRESDREDEGKGLCVLMGINVYSLRTQ